MRYFSTRGSSNFVSGAEAIVEGIALDGGLFVPEKFPSLDVATLSGLSYPEISARVLGLYLPEFDYDTLLKMTSKAYSRFDGYPAPLANVREGVFSLELWHGNTFAFKDIALTVLPHLLVASKKKLSISSETLILVATSGDTGKAALEGFCDVEGTRIIVLYPNSGVSAIQKLQMTTQCGSNVAVLGIKGNFDDAQTAVKNIFTDSSFADFLAQKNISLSSANSINIGRLLPQIAYYFSAYRDLVDKKAITLGDKINFCVPSGNFGNILAGYYALRMGLPVNKLICASNSNNILTDFFSSGEYDTRREFLKTSSPSMDILVSSNLERLLFEAEGRNPNSICNYMANLRSKGLYKISPSSLPKCFWAGYASEEEVALMIRATYEGGYLVDPHTAVALKVLQNYQDSIGDITPSVVVSTASPAKFAEDVVAALQDQSFKSGISSEDTANKSADAKRGFKSLQRLAELSGFVIPNGIAALEGQSVRFDRVIDKDKIASAVKESV